jgi:hypothetical protein
MVRRLSARALALALLVAAAPSAGQEPQINDQSRVTVVGCVETQSGFAQRLANGGAPPFVPAADPEKQRVLTGAAPAQGGSGISGDFALSGTLEAQLYDQAGSRIEVSGVVEDLNEHALPDGTRVLRRLLILSWQPAGGCTP